MTITKSQYRFIAIIFTLAALLALPAVASAGTTVPGHSSSRYDQDSNGYPDAGRYVVGHYTSVYAYDSLGGWYQDLGDGRVFGTVSSVDELDADTRTVCTYVNNYRADFGNDAYMNEGWIQNHIVCQGVDRGTYNYLIVSQTDPRYTGNPEWSVWNTWEYHVLTVSGEGNLVQDGPSYHVGS